jgi:hypothetical protein
MISFHSSQLTKGDIYRVCIGGHCHRRGNATMVYTPVHLEARQERHLADGMYIHKQDVPSEVSITQYKNANHELITPFRNTHFHVHISSSSSTIQNILKTGRVCSDFICLMDQCSIVGFLHLKELNAARIHHELSAVLRPDAMPYSTVTRILSYATWTQTGSETHHSEIDPLNKREQN